MSHAICTILWRKINIKKLKLKVLGLYLAINTKHQTRNVNVSNTHLWWIPFFWNWLIVVARNLNCWQTPSVKEAHKKKKTWTAFDDTIHNYLLHTYILQGIVLFTFGYCLLYAVFLFILVIYNKHIDKRNENIISKLYSKFLNKYLIFLYSFY